MVQKGIYEVNRRNRPRRVFAKRQSQRVLIVVNLVLLLFFLVLIHTSLNFYIFFRRAIYIHKKDEAQFKKYSKTIEMHSYPFLPPPEEFNQEFCAEHCGNYAFAYRVRKVAINSSEWAHLDREQKQNSGKYHHYQLVDCHESLRPRNSTECEPPRNNITECPGIYVHQHNFTDNLYEGVKIVPAIDEDRIKELKGRVLLSNEIVLQCPRCQISSSSSFKLRANEANATCYKKISTRAFGWPARFGHCTTVVEDKNDTGTSNITDSKNNKSATECPLVH